MAEFNFTAKKPESNVIPKATYRLVISGEEVKPTSAGNGTRLSLKFTVIGGTYNGKSFFQGYNLENPNPTAVQISKDQLSEICFAIGLPGFTHTSQLLNAGGQISKPFDAYVDIKDGQNGLENVLKKPRAINRGNAPASVPPTTLASDTPPAIGQDAPEVSAPWATGA